MWCRKMLVGNKTCLSPKNFFQIVGLAVDAHRVIDCFRVERMCPNSKNVYVFCRVLESRSPAFGMGLFMFGVRFAINTLGRGFVGIEIVVPIPTRIAAAISRLGSGWPFLSRDPTLVGRSTDAPLTLKKTLERKRPAAIFNTFLRLFFTLDPLPAYYELFEINNSKNTQPTEPNF